MPPVETADLPKALAEIAEDFVELSVPERLQLLLEFSEELPQLPERYAGAPEQMEQVHECQSPLFLVVEVDEAPRPTLRSASSRCSSRRRRRHPRRAASPASCARDWTS